VKYTGFRAITAGLQADTFIEAFDVEKQKQEYSALLADREEHAAMVSTSVYALFVLVAWETRGSVYSGKFTGRSVDGLWHTIRCSDEIPCCGLTGGRDCAGCGPLLKAGILHW
jgi:hypothetical protein